VLEPVVWAAGLLAHTERIHVYPLRHARRALLDEARTRERIVADIALRSGFADLGRFAAQFREQLGETPSQTLHGGAT
jgi:AraC-like DNA-binding protein